MMQKQSWQLYLGAMGRFYFGDTYYKGNNASNHVALGLFMRANNTVVDAIIPSLKVEIFAFTINLSFDANVSGLRKASKGYGALELGLSYVMSKGKFDRVNRMPNPDF